jgi:hypothetical protein
MIKMSPGLSAGNSNQSTFIIEDDSFADILQKIDILDPMGNLVHLLENRKAGELQFPLRDSVVAMLMRGQGGYAQLPPIRLVNPGALATVIDGVRTTVLDWSINLENEGILGEGMLFSLEEKDKAIRSQSIHIQSFSGILGDVSGRNRIEQRISQTVNASDFRSLSDAVRQLGVSEKDIQDLLAAISVDAAPSSSQSLGPETSGWIGRMVAKAGSGGLAVGVGAAGDLLSRAILVYYGIDG